MATAMGTEYTGLGGGLVRAIFRSGQALPCNHDRRKMNFHVSHWCLDCLLVQLVTGFPEAPRIQPHDVSGAFGPLLRK